MDITIYRRVLILMTCPMSIACAGPAKADPVTFKVSLTGAQCTPPVETAATGTADITYDPATRLVSWIITHGGLSSPATQMHFHGPATAGSKGPVAVWLSKKGSTPGNPVKDETTLSPEQSQQFAAGQWYVNVHTQSNPACELRGQVRPPKG